MQDDSGTYQYVMKCGCVAFAYRVIGDDRIPCCFTHTGMVDADGDDIGMTIAKPQPDLSGRVAKCGYGCGAEKPSSHKLPFFEFRGEGSWISGIKCKHCGYYEIAHTASKANTCDNFEPHGPFEFDEYYCGCMGWD